MITLTANKKFDWNLPITEKVGKVMRAFGITVQRMRANAINHQCKIEISPGEIIYLTGPSGSGKSVLLKTFYENLKSDNKINIENILLSESKTCVDAFDEHPPKGSSTTLNVQHRTSNDGISFIEILRTLSNAGLTDVFCVLNSPANLSEGQKYRYRIAKAIASEKQYIFADEFCSNLDRVTAAVICHNLRKIASKTKKTFILASSHDDLLADLQPDVIVIKHLAGDSEIIKREE